MSYEMQNPRFIKAFVQAGVLAQGLLQCLAIVAPPASFGCEPFVPASRPPNSSWQTRYARHFPNFSCLPQKAILSRNSSLSGRTQKICGLSAWLREQKDGLLRRISSAKNQRWRRPRFGLIKVIRAGLGIWLSKRSISAATRPHCCSCCEPQARCQPAWLLILLICWSATSFSRPPTDRARPATIGQNGGGTAHSNR
jgi:hypothetical protein